MMSTLGVAAAKLGAGALEGYELGISAPVALGSSFIKILLSGSFLIESPNC